MENRLIQICVRTVTIRAFLLLALWFSSIPFALVSAQDTLPGQDPLPGQDTLPGENSTFEELIEQELPPEEIPIQDLSLAAADNTMSYLTPLYWAQRHDIYKEAGINLKLLTGAEAGEVVATVAGGRTPVGIADINAFMRSRSEGSDLIAIMLLHNHLSSDPHWNQATGIALLIASNAFLSEQDDLVRSFVQATQQAYVTCAVTPDPCIAAHARVSGQSTQELTEKWRQLLDLIRTPGEQRNRGFGFFDPDIMRHVAGAAQASGIKAFDITDAYTNAYTDQRLRLSN